MYYSTKIFFIIFLTLIFVLFDRVLWSNIAQWQVDEATTIYIGYTKLISDIKVGLISSQGIPNPNGMMFLSKFLSFFPNLWSSSYILSLTQFLMILILCYYLSKINKDIFLIIFVSLIFCLCLRSISTHLSNQWILTLVNFLFLICVVNYLKTPSVNKLILFAFPILIAPSIYLAGITNSFAYFVSILFILYFYPVKFSKKSLIIFLISNILIILIFIYFIWYPYFKIISINEILFSDQKENLNLFKKIFHTLINYPYWFVFLSAGEIFGTFKHNGLETTTYPFWSIFHYYDDRLKDLKIFYDGPLSNTSITLLRINSIILIIQSIISSFLLVLFLLFKNIFKIADKKIAIFVILNFLFIFLIIIIGSILGSPDWVNGKRLDMQVHLVPLFIIFWFSFGWIFQIKYSFNKYIKILLKMILISYVFTNIISGYFVYRDHISYKGKILSDADIPLIQKQEAIDYIVEDWRSNSNGNKIRVGYYFPDKRFSWINKFGEKYFKYYPSVYIRGREYDYILLRTYGLTNYQEGIQNRAISKNEYIVTYNTMNLNTDNSLIEFEKEIGRLKILKFKMKLQSKN